MLPPPPAFPPMQNSPLLPPSHPPPPPTLLSSVESLLMEIQQGEKLHPVKLKICLTEPNLLSQIRDGIKLHPMIKTSASSNSSEDLPRLLDQIRAGVVLRPVTERGSIEDGELEGNGERTGERRDPQEKYGLK